MPSNVLQLSLIKLSTHIKLQYTDIDKLLAGKHEKYMGLIFFALGVTPNNIALKNYFYYFANKRNKYQSDNKKYIKIGSKLHLINSIVDIISNDNAYRKTNEEKIINKIITLIEFKSILCQFFYYAFEYLH